MYSPPGTLEAELKLRCQGQKHPAHLQKPEGSTLIQKGPGDVFPGTLPVIFLFVPIELLVALTIFGSPYKKI